MVEYCPGISHITNPYPEDIVCSQCLFTNEIWSDEVKINCINCGSTICRDISIDCLKWCKYAKKCIGEEKYRKIFGS